MNDINKLLDISGTFNCTEKPTIPFIGSLIRKGKDIYFECSIKEYFSENLEDFETLDWMLHGCICNTHITLIHTSIRSIEMANDSIHLEMDPSEIIIGKEFAGEIYVTRMAINLITLNYMFSKKPLHVINNFSKEKSAIVELTYPKALSAVDDDGKILIYQTITIKSRENGVEIPVNPVVEYRFNEPTELKKAIAKLASARNLFSFFADYYIPLENMTFTDNSSEDCNLYLNFMGDIEVPKTPFLIQTNAFIDDFESIWKRWTEFYNNEPYIPNLFYEIICNRSTQINCFLNLTQAIEVFSTKYRDREAREVYEQEQRQGEKSNRQKKKNESRLSLSYRIQDILTWLNIFFNLKAPEINDTGNKISAYRNFFTHYNIEKYKEPSIWEIDSSSNILRFVLLAIIYRTVGIKDEYVKENMGLYFHGSPNQDINIILGEQNAKLIEPALQ